MTKIKNTKKGMAKKTLSVSLTVAMLATSNVPVWAAEDLFSAGEAVEAEVVVPVEDASETDVFSTEPVAEAPVVDETEDIVAAKSTQVTTSSKYNFDSIRVKTDLMNPSWVDFYSANNTSGKTIKEFLESGSKITTVNSETVTTITSGELKQVWKYGDTWDESEAVNITNADFNNSSEFAPVKGQANAGKTLTMLILEQNTAGSYDIVKEIPFGTIQKVDLNTVLAGKISAANTDITYNGTDIKKAPTVTSARIDSKYVGLSGLDATKFTWNYSSNTGEYKNANTLVTATGTLIDPIDGYTTTVTAPAYKIAKRTLQATDIVVKLTNPGKAFSYEGNSATVVPKNEVSVYLKEFDTTKLANESDVVASVVSMDEFVKEVQLDTSSLSSTNGNGAYIADKPLKVVFDTNALKASNNFEFDTSNLSNITSTNNAETSVTDSTKKNVKVGALNLAECTITLKAPVQARSKDNNALIKNDIDVIVSKDGKVLTNINATTGTTNNKVGITLADGDYSQPGTYSGVITVSGNNGTIIGSKSIDLKTVSQAFSSNAKFIGSKGSYLKSTKAEAAADGNTNVLDYNNGKAVEFKGAFTVDGELGYFSPDGSDDYAGDQTNFRITYDNNINASYTDENGYSVAKLTVTAVAGNYAGCSKDFYFKIKPSQVKVSATAAQNTVSTNLSSTSTGIALKEEYTSAAQYADAIGLKINGTNDPDNSLASDKKITSNTTADDYTVKYSFETSNSGTNGTGENVVGNYIRVEAKLKKNGNFAGVASNATFITNVLTGTVTGAGADNNGTIVLYVKITDKSIDNLDISLKEDTFTFTGETIKPEVIVKDNGRLITDGITIKEIKEGVNVGTATIKVSVTGYTGTKELKATIIPANLSDVVFEIKKAEVDNKTYTYDGRQKKPTIAQNDDPTTTENEAIDEDNAKADVKLDKVIVSKMFDITYGENINAGEKAGTVTLTPKAAYAKNFNGSSLTANFEIYKAVLEMTDGTSITNVLELKDSTGKKVAITAGSTDPWVNTISNPSDKLTWTDEGAKFASAKVAKGSFKAERGLKTGLNVIEDDYELVYVNAAEATTTNAKAYVAIVGKGNFTGAYAIVKDKNGVITVKTTDSVSEANKTNPGTYTVLQDGVIKATATSYDITGRKFYAKDIAVADGTYAGGLTVKPVVTVKDTTTGTVLEEDKDYTINIKDAAINATTTPITFEVIGKGQYKGSKVDKTTSGKELSYIINKKDLKDCFVDVTKKEDALELTVMNGNVTEKTEKFDVTDNGDGTATVSVVDDGKNYTGSVTVDIVDPEKPGTVGKAMIADVEVVGNKATVVLSGDVDNASGYDYVIATEEDYQNGRVDIVKNQIKTTADFTYVQKGTYYAYCHAWTRGTDGKKVFGDWSNIFKFDVYTTTPAQPVITSVKRSGSTVTVTYTQAANADGYDVVLGTKTAVVNGEKRPVNYGTLVKKNVKGDTVTVTFKDVPAGTYYAGLHAWNRSSLDNKKVFSPWSNIKTVTVK